MSPRVLQTTVADDRHAGRLACERRRVDRGDLRDTHTCDHARRADRAGADADLHGVDARVDEGLRTRDGRDVAADDLHAPGRPVGLEAADHVEHEARVAVRGVDDQHVHAGVDQSQGPVPRVTEEPDSRPDHKTPFAVLRRDRVLLRLHEVLHRDEATEHPVAVDERQLLDLVLGQQRRGVLAGDPHGGRDERHDRHHLADVEHRVVARGDEPQVAVRDDAEKATGRVDDREPRDTVLAAQLVELGERGLRTDGDGVRDHARLGALDEVDLVGLVVDRQVAVQDADTALAGHRDRHARLGDRVHRRRHQGDGDGDLARQARGRVDLARDDVRLAREQQHVVVGQADVAEGVGSRSG